MLGTSLFTPDASVYRSGVFTIALSVCLSLTAVAMLGRFGGEEFVVLLPETGTASALQLTDRMRMEVSRIGFADIPDVITISAGLATIMKDETGDELLKRSDRALYQAKDEGRNCCRIAYDPIREFEPIPLR